MGLYASIVAVASVAASSAAAWPGAPDLATPAGWLPIAFLVVMGLSMLAYVVLDGYDLGVGILPDYVTEDFPQLVRVLHDVESGEVPVFLAYPEELGQSKRIAAFRDFVQEEVIAHRLRLRDAAA